MCPSIFNRFLAAAVAFFAVVLSRTFDLMWNSWYHLASSFSVLLQLGYSLAYGESGLLSIPVEVELMALELGPEVAVVFVMLR